ncbi:uncharacterized protein [Argopecten irradians]|uniref:uncharacterized protein n=1 Tax=Argopecten irradians TaxID=31199 RepID=UPI00372150B0
MVKSIVQKGLSDACEQRTTITEEPLLSGCTLAKSRLSRRDLQRHERRQSSEVRNRVKTRRPLPANHQNYVSEGNPCPQSDLTLVPSAVDGPTKCHHGNTIGDRHDDRNSIVPDEGKQVLGHGSAEHFQTQKRKSFGSFEMAYDVKRVHIGVKGVGGFKGTGFHGDFNEGKVHMY